MDKRSITPKQQFKKPSKLSMLFALAISFFLPYFLVTHFPHSNKTQWTKQSITLPQLTAHLTDQFTNSSPIEPKIENKKNTPAKKGVTTLKNRLIRKLQPIDQWQIVNPRSGDSMASIFHRLGLSARNLHEILQSPHAKALKAIKPGLKLQFLIKKNKLEQLILPINQIQTLKIYREGIAYKSLVSSKQTIKHEQYVTGTVQGSLYSTARRLQIPSKLIRQMTQILSKEIDFSRSIRTGDQFSIAYDAYYIEGKMLKIGDILAVTYTNRGKTFQAISHTQANGAKDYYTPQGNSLKKAYSRYPLQFSHISSTFSLSRVHPILHYKRAHKGIDLAAPIGTPIQATGDGIITMIGRHNGYGNMIKIKHDKTYSTVYGHMLKFQRGLSRGSKIKRGQIIGYVGQTGLATGPHCHYELHVNNQPRNPTTTSLPAAAPVSSKEMAAFKAKTRMLIAHLELVAKTAQASAKRKSVKMG